MAFGTPKSYTENVQCVGSINFTKNNEGVVSLKYCETNRSHVVPVVLSLQLMQVPVADSQASACPLQLHCWQLGKFQ